MLPLLLMKMNVSFMILVDDAYVTDLCLSPLCTVQNKQIKHKSYSMLGFVGSLTLRFCCLFYVLLYYSSQNLS